MESTKEEQEKAPEQPTSVESPTENQPKIDVYEQMKTLSEEEKKL
jgi:hypothetical protein